MTTPLDYIAVTFLKHCGPTGGGICPFSFKEKIDLCNFNCRMSSKNLFTRYPGFQELYDEEIRKAPGGPCACHLKSILYLKHYSVSAKIDAVMGVECGKKEV